MSSKEDKDCGVWEVLPASAFKWSMQGASWITEAETIYAIGRDGSLIFYQIGYSNLAWPSTTCQLSARYFKAPSIANGTQAQPHAHGAAIRNVFETQTFSAMRMQMSADYASVKVSGSQIEQLATRNSQDHLELLRAEFTEGSTLALNLFLKPLVQPMQIVPGGLLPLKSADAVESGGEFIRMSFVPMAHVMGSFTIKQQDGAGEEIGRGTGKNNLEVPFEGTALVVRQFQGVKPHVCAERWNLAYWIADTARSGQISAGSAFFQIQLVTKPGYGSAKHNYGMGVLDGAPLFSSTGNSIHEGDHKECPESALPIPQFIHYEWRGRCLDTEKSVRAWCETRPDKQCACVSLLDNVPYALRKVVEMFVAKPYVYEWLDRAQMHIQIEGEEERVLEGWIFQEICLV